MVRRVPDSGQCATIDFLICVTVGRKDVVDDAG
jgi:hypothetical protein